MQTSENSTFLGITVNKPPADVPEAAGWHHEWYRLGRETQIGKEEEAPVTSAEEKNKALVRRFLEARVTGDVDAVEEMLTPDFVNHTKVLPDEEPGREGFVQAIAQYNAAFSNSSVLIED
jgi:SnoaL-like polyketide cyclase